MITAELTAIFAFGVSACATTPPPAHPRPPAQGPEPSPSPQVYTCTVRDRVETCTPPPDVWTDNLAPGPGKSPP